MEALPISLAEQCLRNGRYRDGAQALSLALDDWAPQDDARLSALLLLAQLRLLAEEYETAISVAMQGSALAMRLERPAHDAEAQCVCAGALARIGLRSEGFQLAALALERARRMGDLRIEALALFRLSWHDTESGNLEEARRLLDSSLACASAVGDSDLRFWALNNISDLIGTRAAQCAAAGDRAGAARAVAELREVVTRALDCARANGNVLQQAYATSNLADAFIVEGDLDSARTLIAEYEALARRIGFRRLLGYARLDQVRLLRTEGRLAEAASLLDDPRHHETVAASEDLAHRTAQALYALYKELGAYPEALRWLETAHDLQLRILNANAQCQARVLLERLDLESARAVAERERDALRRVAREDPLTGLGNRRAADEALDRSGARPAEGPELFIAILDVDHFKTVNDTYGHSIGDRVLARIGAILAAQTREGDAVFRIGGEEFLLKISVHSAAHGADTFERLRQAIAAFDWTSIQAGMRITVSIGAARCGRDEPPAAAQIRADAALYRAKNTGRDRVVID